MVCGVKTFIPSEAVNSVCQYPMPRLLSEQQWSCLSLKHVITDMTSKIWSLTGRARTPQTSKMENFVAIVNC